MRKSLIATGLVAMVALSACSSKSEETTETTSATTSVTATDSSTSESPEASPTDATPSAETPNVETPAAEAAAPTSLDQAQLEAQASQVQQQLAEQLNQMNSTFAPVQGDDASQADVDAIRAVVNNIFGQPTFRGVVRASLDNACSDIIAEAGGTQAAYAQLNDIPDLPLGTAAITVSNVTDAKVNGDEASATVSMTAGGQTQATPMKFKKENGTWKYCTLAQ
ncbi:MAG: hypothetical protein Q3972_05280 [Corynebacterium sp.]|nr:hypothetical protein [Corynebacterium sp.]